MYDRALVNPDYKDWGPRLGFAYNFAPKMVVRGGYGISYDFFNRVGSAIEGINAPQALFGVFSQTIPAGGPVPSTFLTTLNSFTSGIANPSNFNPLVSNVDYIPANSPWPYIQNWFLSLLREIGKTRKPVLLKRGIAATIEELLLAAEYIMSGGNYDVILCERGIRTFETAMRNTFDAAGIALLKQITHLPIIADPSHAAGHRELVPALARISVAAGADGLIVEVHPNPDKAWSDGEQSLDFAGFNAMMRELNPWLALRGQTDARFAEAEPTEAA